MKHSAAELDAVIADRDGPLHFVNLLSHYPAGERGDWQLVTRPLLPG